MSVAVTAVRGAVWTIATGVGARALGLIGTLVLTHFFSPDTLGEVSVATVLVLTANQFSTIQTGQYLIAKKDAGPEVAWHIVVMHLSLGLVLLSALIALRGPLGPVFNAPLMGQYIPGMALAAFLDRVGMVPEKLLVRDMRFRTVGLSRTAGELTYTIGSVALAAMGWGPMAIVAANVLRAIVLNGSLIRATELRQWLTPSPFRADVAKTLLAYGVPLSIGSASEFAARRWDNLLVARFYGTSVMGNYNLAYNLADVPAAHVGEHIGEVLMPSFARMSPEECKSALVRSTSLLALVIFPLAVGLGAVAPALVAAFFDTRWAEVAPMLTLLSVLSVARPIGWTINSYQQARMQPRAVMALGIAKVVFLMAALLTLGRLGALWACTAVGIGFALHALCALWIVQRTDGVSMWRFLGGLVPPMIACVPMVGVVIGLHHLLPTVAPALALVVQIVLGGTAYVLSALVIARKTSRDFIDLLRKAIRR